MHLRAMQTSGSQGGDQTRSNTAAIGSNCDPRRTVSLEAFIRGTTVAVTVADSGRWSGDSSAS
jgi:hypothetical protein